MFASPVRPRRPPVKAQLPLPPSGLATGLAAGPGKHKGPWRQDTQSLVDQLSINCFLYALNRKAEPVPALREKESKQENKMIALGGERSSSRRWVEQELAELEGPGGLRAGFSQQ